MSDQENTENFLEFWQSFQWPEIQPVIYRLYHDDEGRPIIYTMEDLPGTYIEVDQATYIYGSFGVKVVEGKLIIIQPAITAKKLQPSQDQGTPCDPRDVCVVVDHGVKHQKWNITTNEIR
jgi:hypothetical protein